MLHLKWEATGWVSAERAGVRGQQRSISPDVRDGLCEMSAPRVLTVVADLGIGGTQRVAQNISMGLHRRGVPVAVFAHKGGGSRSAPLKAAGVPVFVNAPGSDALAAALSWRPEVIHIHRQGYENREETKLLRRFRGIGARIVETNVFARFDHSERSLIDAHCVLTEWCLFKWAYWGGRDATSRRAYVVPNAVEPDAINGLPSSERLRFREELGILGDRFVFGRVGQPISSKWSPAILSSFNEAVSRGLDIGLLLVGAPNDIRNAVHLLPLATRERIVLRGETASDVELGAYYSAMDAMLHAAQIGETFGMVLCEAMLLGKPVITLSTPFKDNGQLEVVGHGKGGLVALQPEQLVEAMEQLVRDPDLYRRLADGSRRWVTERFSTSVVVDKYCRIYDAVLDHAAGEPPDVAPTIQWAAGLASRGIGRPLSRVELLALRLLHLPQIYRPYLVLRRALGRL